jgi:hypothetical protein
MGKKLLRAEPGIQGVYILHITPRFEGAGHYLGWSDDIMRRVYSEHLRGGYAASPLVRAALAAGCEVKLARIFPGKDRHFEKALKDRKNTPKLCPCCNEKVEDYVTFDTTEWDVDFMPIPVEVIKRLDNVAMVEVYGHKYVVDRRGRVWFKSGGTGWTRKDNPERYRAIYQRVFKKGR